MATNSLAITQTEILEALAAAAAGDAPNEARTLQELAESTGVTSLKVRRALLEYQKQGRLANHRVQRLAIDGTQRWVAAYTILPAKKSGKR